MQDEKRTKLTQDPQRSKLEGAGASYGSSQASTPLDAPSAPAAKLVKVRALRAVKVNDELMLGEGQVADVTEAEAAALCVPFAGTFGFVGSREGGDPEVVEQLYRAERIG